MPGGEEGEEEEEEERDEGVREGGNSVLQERGLRETAEDMDTIARSASHSYYLRSLHKPESIAGVRGPGAVLEVPQLPAEGVSAVARTYLPFPRPSLPPPPMPQGQSSADLYQSLDARDEQIRKSKPPKCCVLCSLIFFLFHFWCFF